MPDTLATSTLLLGALRSRVLALDVPLTRTDITSLGHRDFTLYVKLGGSVARHAEFAVYMISATYNIRHAVRKSSRRRWKESTEKTRGVGLGL